MCVCVEVMFVRVRVLVSLLERKGGREGGLTYFVSNSLTSNGMCLH